jgi:D-galactarolactone isomerase
MNAASAFAVPAGACDCHVHFYGDPHAYPPRADAGLAPQRGSAAEYRVLMQRLGVERVVAVQSILYGFDNRCMLDGMAQIGAGARGIAVVSADTAAAELSMLDDRGVRGARAFMLPGGVLAWDELAPIAQRISQLGWLLQVQLDGRELPQRLELLASLPCPVVIDHIGKFLEPVAPAHPSFQALLRLLDSGGCWVKLSAPYETSRTGPPRFADVSLLASALVRYAPARMLWASNWPHAGRDPKPDDAALLDLLLAWSPDQEVRNRILVDNPAALYGFDQARKADARGSHAELAGEAQSR